MVPFNMGIISKTKIIIKITFHKNLATTFLAFNKIRFEKRRKRISGIRKYLFEWLYQYEINQMQIFFFLFLFVQLFLSNCNFIKNETLAQVFSVNFVKFLRTPFYIEHLWWLLLFFLILWFFLPVNLVLQIR